MTQADFPTYFGPPLPKTLRFYDPRHWLLVLTWVYFQPSHLKQYLYQADPELYFATGAGAFRRSLYQPSFRSLLTTGICVVPISSGFLLSLLYFMGFDIHWMGAGSGIVSGLMSGLVISLVFVGVGWDGIGVGGGVAYSLPVVVVASTAFSVNGGVGFSIVNGFWSNVTGGVVLGVALGVGGNVTFGTALGVWIGVAIGMAYFVAFGLTGRIGGMALGLGLILGGVRIPFWILEVTAAIVLRLYRTSPFPNNSASCHPALWDEMAVLPLPGGIAYLRNQLDESVSAGLVATRALLRNPWQAWIVRAAWWQLFSVAPGALSVFYELCRHHEVADAIVEPLALRQEQRAVISVRIGLLAALSNRPFSVNTLYTGFSDFLTHWLTAKLSSDYETLRSRALAELALIFLALERLDRRELSEERVLQFTEEFRSELQHDFKEFAEVFGSPEAAEVAGSIMVMIAVLEPTNMDELAALEWPRQLLNHLLATPAMLLRADVIECLRGLGDVQAEVASYNVATSFNRRSSALNRAVGMLEEISERIDAIPLTERIMLKAVIVRWSSLVAQASGRLGEQMLRESTVGADRAQLATQRQSTLWTRRLDPYPNPYMVGPPVRGSTFVGREDILARIAERWRAGGQTTSSIILYGHRRMGKTSILLNLADRVPSGWLLVHVNLKGEKTFWMGLGDLLLGIVTAICSEAAKRWGELPTPRPDAFEQLVSAKLAFDRLLRFTLQRMPPWAVIILALDEFEAIEDAVREGKLPTDVYDWLRTLSQQPRISLILAGLHTLDEMSQDYQQAFLFLSKREGLLPFSRS